MYMYFKNGFYSMQQVPKRRLIVFRLLIKTASVLWSARVNPIELIQDITIYTLAFTMASASSNSLPLLTNDISSSNRTIFTFSVSATLLVAVASLPTPDEERYFDKELNRDLINWLTSIHYAQTLNNPCRYYAGNTLTAPMPKRNSELINSLLSLPKNMNDAGK